MRMSQLAEGATPLLSSSSLLALSQLFISSHLISSHPCHCTTSTLLPQSFQFPCTFLSEDAGGSPRPTSLVLVCLCYRATLALHLHRARQYRQIEVFLMDSPAQILTTANRMQLIYLINQRSGKYLFIFSSRPILSSLPRHPVRVLFDFIYPLHIHCIQIDKHHTNTGLIRWFPFKICSHPNCPCRAASETPSFCEPNLARVSSVLKDSPSHPGTWICC